MPIAVTINVPSIGSRKPPDLLCCSRGAGDVDEQAEAQVGDALDEHEQDDRRPRSGTARCRRPAQPVADAIDQRPGGGALRARARSTCRPRRAGSPALRWPSGADPVALERLLGRPAGERQQRRRDEQHRGHRVDRVAPAGRSSAPSRFLHDRRGQRPDRLEQERDAVERVGGESRARRRPSRA